MIQLNNINNSGTFFKNNNSFSDDEWRNLIEGLWIISILIAGVISFICLCRVLKCVMWGHDSNNPAEEVPLQQEMMNMNGNIPNNQNNNIEVPLIAENGEAGL